MIKNAIISVQTLNKKATVEVDSALMFSFQNTGTATMYVGINEKANANLTIAPGESMSFRATKDTMYHDQELNIDFGSTGDKACRVVIETLAEDITAKVCN